MVDFTKYDLEKAKFLASRLGKSVASSMIENVQSFDLVGKSNLLQSIKSRVSTSRGQVDKISFTYAWYGVFHEIGIAGTGNTFEAGGKFEAKKPSRKMVQSIMENYSVSQKEAFAIGLTILRTGIKKNPWRSKAFADNMPSIDREFSEFYAEMALKEIEFEDIKL